MTIPDLSNMSLAQQPKLPGRLGNPVLRAIDDPRINAKLLAQMKALGGGEAMVENPVSSRDSLEVMAKSIAEVNAGTLGLYNAVDLTLPGDENEAKVERSDLEIDGSDGNKVKLHVFRRFDTKDKTLPCVVYMHGGGMTILPTINQVHVRWLTSLALEGVVAIAVDFRNAWTEEKRNAFPAGLNDCVAGVRYVAEHKAELKVGKIVVQGESGGGNLAIAAGLKAKREGWISSIDGIYANVPFISGAYGWPKERMLQELPSLMENDGYFVTLSGMDVLSGYYTYEKEDKENPLAWPYFATQDDLKGLPPHVIHVDELDPLRDEGMVYCRNLSSAGVSVVGKMNLGMMHASEIIFRKAVPEMNESVVQSVIGFIKGL